jgi:broad specificity phosphatase PhoE
MRRIVLIRHGEPEHGWGEADDPGLSARGHAQAAAAAEALSALAPLRIVTSPMRRCRETAAPYAARLGAEASVEPRVSEVATPAGIADRRAWLAHSFPWRAGVAPTLWSALPPSLWAWRADVLSAPVGWEADCAVFTHFIAINTLAGAALGRPETIVCRPDHTSITELTIDDGRLRLVHLGAEMSEGDVR